jgi:hypothetical protein
MTFKFHHHPFLGRRNANRWSSKKKILDFQINATSVDNLTISHVHAPYSMHPKMGKIHAPKQWVPFLTQKNQI